MAKRKTQPHKKGTRITKATLLKGKVVKKGPAGSDKKIKFLEKRLEDLKDNVRETNKELRRFNKNLAEEFEKHETPPKPLREKKNILEKRVQTMVNLRRVIRKMINAEKAIYDQFAEAKKEMSIKEAEFAAGVLEERMNLYEAEIEFNKKMDRIEASGLMPFAEHKLAEERDQIIKRIEKYCNDSVSLVMPDWRKRERFVNAFFTPKEIMPDVKFPGDPARLHLSTFCEVLAREQRYKMVFFRYKGDLANSYVQLKGLNEGFKRKGWNQWI